MGVRVPLWRLAFIDNSLKRFREEIVLSHGGIHCWEISGVDWKIREQVVNYYKGGKVKECARIVGETAKLIGEMLERKA